MITKVNLTEVKTCDQNWDLMTPCERGRICGKCEKTIIDFREMSEAEIARMHAFSEENLCGVYRDEQLELNHSTTSKSKFSPWKSILVGFGGLFSSVNLNSQSTIADNNTDNIEVTWNQKFVNEIKIPTERSETEIKPIVIQGSVNDKNGKPVPYATVVLKNTTFGTNTDNNGKFVIDLTNYFQRNDVGVLEIKLIGIATRKIELHKSSFSNAVVHVIATKIEPQRYSTVFRASVREVETKRSKFRRWLFPKRNKNKSKK